MSLPGTPHVAKIGLLYTNYLEGNKCENVFYVQDPTDDIFVTPGTFCTQVFGAAVGHLIAQLSPFVILNGVSFEDVRTVPFGGLVQPEAATAGTNAAGGTQLPASAALAIKKVTGTLGRGGRGRWYFPIGSSGSLLNGNDVLAAVATNIAGALTDFQLALETGGLPVSMGIVSYFSGGAPRVAGQFSRILTWGAGDTHIDSQRRRLAGRGA